MSTSTASSKSPSTTRNPTSASKPAPDEQLLASIVEGLSVLDLHEMRRVLDQALAEPVAEQTWFPCSRTASTATWSWS